MKQIFFLKFSFFFYDLTDVCNLISGSSAFSKSSLYIWKFLVHILLKPSLKDFEHGLANMWNECNCMVVWTFFGIAFLWDWNENWLFPFLWLLLSSKFECSTLTASYFRIWNSSAGTPLPPLASFVIMLRKAHLTLWDVWLYVSDHTIMVLQVIKTFSCTVLWILATSS